MSERHMIEILNHRILHMGWLWSNDFRLQVEIGEWRKHGGHLPG